MTEHARAAPGCCRRSHNAWGERAAKEAKKVKKAKTVPMHCYIHIYIYIYEELSAGAAPRIASDMPGPLLGHSRVPSTLRLPHPMN